MTKTAKVKYYTFLFAKIVIAIMAFYFIYKKISDQPLKEIFFRLNSINYFFLMVIALFSVINWLGEIVKWKLLSSKIKIISFKESITVVMSSFVASIITPNKIGEYGAKVMFHKKEKLKEVLSYNFFGNMMQLLITLLMSIIGYLLMKNDVIEENLLYVFLVIFLATIFLIILLFIKKISIKTPWLSNNVKLRLWTSLSTKLRLQILLISFTRYLAFSFQFILLMYLFNVQITLMIFSLLTLNYLLISVVPTIFLGDLLIRGSVSMFLFSLVDINEITIITVVFIAWIFNFVVPALIGIISMTKIKN